MTSGPSTCLVDTNVLVYSVDPRDPRKQETALRVLQRLESDRRSCLSVQVLGEFFNAVTRKIRPPLSLAVAADALEDLIIAFPVLDLTQDVVRLAARATAAYEMSYSDALVWSTARLNNIATVLTEDIRGQTEIEGVRFVNPFVPAFDIASFG